MSRYFLMGGIVGFAVVFFVSFSAGSSVHVALRNGMIGCIALALLVNFLFGRIIAAFIASKIRELEEREKAETGEFHEQSVKK